MRLLLGRLNKLPSRTWTRQLATTSADEHEQFFCYTSGRWLHNEQAQLAARYLKFDVKALQAAAISAVPGATSVLSMAKLAEGNYNKVFKITLDNSTEVIARLPISIAGPRGLVTASEVATMDYVRSQLQLPVPRVLAWCSARETTPVGAEYIIMEEAPGIELYKVWPNLKPRDKLALIHEIVSNGYHVGREAEREDFIMGPSVHRYSWRGKRETMDVDRGPWTTPQDYLRSVVHCEQSWLKDHGVPRTSTSILAPSKSSFDPLNHAQLLTQYASAIPHLVPDDPALLRSTLLHTDLHTGNIFISESELAQGRIFITSIIDWQSVRAGPLYLEARVPHVFKYNTRWMLPSELRVTELPDGFDALGEDGKTIVRANVDAVNTQKYYEAHTLKENPAYFYALSFPNRDTFVETSRSARTPWEDGLHFHLRDCLIGVEDDWPAITRPDTPCPISFSAAEREAHGVEVDEAREMRRLMETLRALVGVEDDDGWVCCEGYDAAVLANEEWRAKWVEAGETENDREELRRAWPFDGPSSETKTTGVILPSHVKAT